MKSSRIHLRPSSIPSTLKERWQHYASLDTSRLAKFFHFRDSVPLVSIDLGSETGISINSTTAANLYLVEPGSWEALRRKMLRYLPESVYYDRNLHSDPSRCLTCQERSRKLGLACSSCDNVIGHEVVFDIDPENLPCDFCGEPRGRNRNSFCNDCLGAAVKEAIRVCVFLQDKGFRRVVPVFTGRGCHIHLQDANVFRWSMDQRKEFTGQLEIKGFRMDPWVSSGEMFLARLPYSLHGVVNREVQALSLRQLRMMGRSANFLLEMKSDYKSKPKADVRQIRHLLEIEKARCAHELGLSAEFSEV